MDPAYRDALVGAAYADDSNDLAIEQPLLAHYTSIDVMEKIITTDEIWFSHPLLMNDHEEVNFGIQYGSQAIEQDLGLKTVLTTDHRHRLLIEGFRKARTNYFGQHLFDTYVFCLSEHCQDDIDGRLSMWRGYGGNGTGAAIVFDTKKLGMLESSPLIVGKVIYGSTADRFSWLAAYVARLTAFLYANIASDEDLDEVGQIVFERLKTAAIFSKHHGFREEQEWRVVYMPERDAAGALKQYLHYHNGAKGVEPKLRFKVAPLAGATAPDLSLEPLIDRIILGPSRSPLAQGAAGRMLLMADKPALASRLIVSGIPFRSIN